MIVNFKQPPVAVIIMVKTKLAINRHSERNISINLSFPFEDIIFNID